MPYIKISDPNIIDISAWHQVISVVNQLTDSVAALTNDFGIAYSPDYTNPGEYSVQYDNSSQKIIYGVLKMNSANQEADNVYYETVSFNSAFSSRPVITATVFSGNQTGSVSQLPDIITSVYNVDNDGFNIKIYKADGTVLTGASGTQGVFINWIAIGPR